ncbi:MFS transporter [Sphingomonas sp. LY160]|uniref:MFS transporter n=1 Tax=Sphingomonas sp. LY160 TaxID=3095342 RepID=UPI002ADED053|nr:MFS transporter [Sphingomonas sp. LY160]MEA1073248.1 MFS transporter [Sphingomonas sp. LY160]
MAARPPLPRTVWILGFVSLLMDLSSEIYHALLPAFLTVTLGLPVAAMGAIDGAAEGVANMAKLASGRLSDRQQRRKPWILLGYGLAALSKPLFPLATTAWPVLGARFVDRVGKGIRGAPRDAMIADETAIEDRGRAFGLRQALDTVGALVAPIAAVGLMLWLAGDIRTVFWIAAIPAALSCLLAWVMLKETRAAAPATAKTAWRGWRNLDAPVRRLIGIGFLFGMARFSESFLILKAIDAGLAIEWSPLVLTVFNLSFLALAYPAGALSDRVEPKNVLLAGIALLVVADLWLAQATALWAIAVGVLLWGAHMALTQGIFARMIADSARDDERASSFGAFYFVNGIAALLASLGAGLLWDREGSAATFTAAAGVAALAGTMLWLLPGDALRRAAPDRSL